ncbi:F-box only protein 8-like [Clavelina lepadiformis]|uniref:F-box only protein 8-like n=1 Tax=Clavelina lepadiformis TaxID=159417 RepID=UPI0040427495
MGQQVTRRLQPEDQNANTWNSNYRRQNLLGRLLRNRSSRSQSPRMTQNFVDLHLLPPELGLEILKNLNATDLCLASCVWSDLANDESLWEGLCMTHWGSCSAYHTWKSERKSFKKLFMLLDEGSLSFNTQPEWGIQYLIEHGVLKDDVKDIAQFFHFTNQLCWQKVRIYLRERQDILEEMIKLQSYKDQFLPNALRKFFHAVDSPTSRGDYLNLLIEKFAERFCIDNPNLRLTPDVITILCYSLILLSVDLTSPHVKNKMSKREFVRNICRAIQRDADHETVVDRDFAGHLYDNVYLVGHIAPQRWESAQSLQRN